MTPVYLKSQYSYDTKTLKESVLALFDSAGGVSKFLSPGKKVILKPNLVHSSGIPHNAITHPAIIEVMIEICQAAGCEVKVMDSPALESAEIVAEKSGILAVCNKYGVGVESFKVPKKVIVGGRTVLTASERDWADLLINLPRVKGHQQVTFTCGVKNLFGTLAGKRKFFKHMQLGDKGNHFGQLILDMAYAAKCTLTLADGIGSAAGRGPTKGVPVNTHFLAMSENPLSLDLAVFDLLKGERQRVPYFRAASEDPYWKVYCNYEAIWLSEIPDTSAFFFPSNEEMANIRFGLIHSIKSIYKTLRNIKIRR